MNLVSSSVVKKASLFFDRVTRSPSGVSILIYHRVGGGTSGSVDLDVSEFERQMETLASTGRAVSLDSALEHLAAGDSRPSIVVTFDDGTRDFTDIAVPIMVRYGIPSLLYAETHPITSGEPNASGCEPTTWSALRDAVSTGLVQVGSHTHTHRLLHTADPATVADELDRSIAAIADNLGTHPTHFAYPKAVRGSAPAEHMVRERFRSAALGHGGANAPGCDVYRLARNPIQRHDTRVTVQAKFDGGMRLEGAMRSALGRWRYRHHER